MGFFDNLVNYFKKENDVSYTILSALNILSDDNSDILTKKVPNKIDNEPLNTSVLNSLEILIDSTSKNDLENSAPYETNDPLNPKNIYKEINELFKEIQIPQQRIEYYNSINELYESFPLSKRIVKQYKSSILRVDPLSKKIITYNKNTSLDIPDYSKIFDLIEEKFNLIEKYYRIPDKLKNNILHTTIIKGNKIVEIVNIDKSTKELLNMIQENEQEKYNQIYNNIKQYVTNNIVNKNRLFEDNIMKNNNIDDFLDLISDYLVEVESPAKYKINSESLEEFPPMIEESETYTNSLSESIYESSELNTEILLDSYLITDNDSSNTTTNDKYESVSIYDKVKYLSDISTKHLRNIKLVFHEPENVIIIHDSSNIYGYLIINTEKNAYTNDITKYLSQIFGADKSSNDPDFDKVVKKAYDKLSDFILKKVMTSIEKEIEDNFIDDIEKKRAILNKLWNSDLDIKHIIKDIIYNKSISKIRVRFVPSDNIVNFYLDNEKWPYGESLLSPLMVYAKLYMLSLMSNVVTKLSRAPVVRKWILETGGVQQQTNLIEKLKRELKNKMVTLDSIGSITSIPQILSDYKDIITVSKNGQRYVDFEVVRTGDPTVDIDDIQYYNRELVALSSIPSVYLGYTDTIELREQLVNANVQFSELIITYQNTIEEKLGELYDKIILNIITTHDDFKDKLSLDDIILPSKLINIQLIKPTILQLQQLEMIFASIGNVLQLLLNAPNIGNKIDVAKFIDKFIPSFNIKEFITDKESVKESEIDSVINQNQQGNNNQQQGGGFGF